MYGKRMQSRAQIVMKNTGTLQSRNGPQPEEPPQHLTGGHAYTFSIGDDKVTPAPAKYLSADTHGHVEHGKGAAHHHTPAAAGDHQHQQSERHSAEGPGYSHHEEDHDQVHSPSKNKPNHRSSSKESHKSSGKLLNRYAV